MMLPTRTRKDERGFSSNERDLKNQRDSKKAERRREKSACVLNKSACGLSRSACGLSASALKKSGSALKRDERGATLLEFAIGATIFFTVLFGVVEFGRALWTHNALADAARRAARYAVSQPASTPAGTQTTGTNVGPSITAIRNVAIYGDPNGGAQPLIPNLAPENINVRYSNFGLGDGTVSVTITGYQFQFILPLVKTSLQMPGYNTTLTAESAGVVPASL